jgi:Tfp pilus assembly protein PilV
MSREFPIAPINPTPRHLSARGHRRSAFTLLEALTASVILAILVLGVFGSLCAAYQQSAAVRADSTGVLLARQLADEIVSKPFDPAIGAAAPPRSGFTNVSNYNGYSDSSTSMPLLAGGSLNVTGSDVYNRSVAVTPGVTPSIDGVSPTTDFAIVTVSVTCPNGQVISIPELVAHYSLQSN